MSHSIKVKLYESKTYANGEHPIVIQVIKDKKVKKILVGETCSVELWDFKENLPKTKHPLFRELEIKITAKKLEVNKLYLNLEEEKKTFSLDELKQKYQNKKKYSTVFQFLDEHIKNLIKADKIGNSDVYKDLKRVLGLFTKRKDLNFSDITSTFLRKFEQDFRENGMSENSMSVYFRTLRSTYNKAIAEGYAKKNDYPFNEFKISKFNTKTKKRAIPKEEIYKIIALPITEDSKLYDTKTMFLFSYFCWGINMFDVAQLLWTNIVNGNLKYTRSKTGEDFNIKLIPQAVEILDYYRAYRVNDYIFPMLSKDRHNSAVSIKNRYKKKLKEFNLKLKEIGELAGITTNLTSYVARHTFATVLKRGGTSTSKISDMLGHKIEQTTQVYLDEFENEVLYQESLHLI